ncbi:hypothetical protein BC332_02978 [Capsicum chinense]|nr:hypothetical protein BC332_02978 [Capsicum chinense]
MRLFYSNEYDSQLIGYVDAGHLSDPHKDEPIFDPDGPTGFLPSPKVIEGADLERESVGIDNSANIKRESIGVEEEMEVDLEDFNLEDVEIENVNLGKEREARVKDINLEDFGVQGGDEVDVEDIHVEDVNSLESELSDYLSGDSDLRDIPSKDSFDDDEKLRAFRQERMKNKANNKERNKKERKKAIETEEVPMEVVGCVDRGFGDIGKNKATKYARKLSRDEEYLDSFNFWSEDSEGMDVDVFRGVYLPRRRRSK